MEVSVLVIGTDLSIREEQVPDGGAEQREALRLLACAGREAGRLAAPSFYHRQAVTWVGQFEAGLDDDPRWRDVLCRPNVLATALASAWRGADLGFDSYWLYGPVVFSGVQAGANVAGLTTDRVQDAVKAQQSYVGLLERWRLDAAPADQGEQWRRVLAAVRSVVPAGAR
ncbi:hypothetical protein ACFWXO_13520 [Kitasatospora sp. NPDC059088]|uniref:hypothetical protein n=1 Tax=Kitasatospora sp. NPDC059088 TaxID=3346722 RepID=UPI00368A8C38